MDLADRLRKARKSAGLSKGDVASRLNVTKDEVDLWEEGEKEPGAEQLLSLAKAYGVSMDSLVTGSAASDEERSYFKEKERKEAAEKNARRFLNRVNYPVFITFLFLCLGIFLNLWHPAWLLFLTIPIFYLPEKYKTPRMLATSPVVLLLIYLILGFYCNLWHPGWLIFFAIPVLNSIMK